LITIASDFSSKEIRSTVWLVLRHASDKARRVPNFWAPRDGPRIPLNGKDLMVLNPSGSRGKIPLRDEATTTVFRHRDYI
jgi:hypothetical protein